MKRTRRWAIIGLLCAGAFLGCAQVPSRGLFIRRSKVAIDEPVSEDVAARTDEGFRAPDQSPRVVTSEERTDSAGGIADSNVDRRSSESPTDATSTGMSGGLFGVSTRSPTEPSDSVEAPPPKRRMITNSSISTGPIEPVDPSRLASLPEQALPSAALMQREGVVAADYQTISGQPSSNIELAGADKVALNPWNRFRNLTSNTEGEPVEGPGHASQPLPQPTANWSTMPTQGSEVIANANMPAVGNADPERYKTESQPIVQPWPQASAQNPGVAADRALTFANTPEPWPHAASGENKPAHGPTSNNGFTPAGTSSGSAGMNATPPTVQWVNAEFPSSYSSSVGINALPGLPSSPQFPIAGVSMPTNVGAVTAVPATIPAFASSPELDRLITQTTVEAAAITPGDSEISRQLYLRKQVQLRLLQLIAGQTDHALQPVSGVDSADQEFWQLMFWGMANYFDTQGMPDSSERATQTISQLRAASARLQERASLQLQNVVFCRKIIGFGNYQRFSRDEFASGQPVLLYAEVESFKSEQTPDGQFRTLMKSTLEIIEGGPHGRLVETLPLTPSEDRCRNQRRDYYHSYEFCIPASCNPGPHTLRLRVEDQLGKKATTTMLNFTVQ